MKLAHLRTSLPRTRITEAPAFLADSRSKNEKNCSDALLGQLRRALRRAVGKCLGHHWADARKAVAVEIGMHLAKAVDGVAILGDHPIFEAI